MKRIALAALLLLTIGLAVQAADKAPAKGVQQCEDAWVAAMKANDVEAIVRCYGSDATVWMSGAARVDGTAAVRATYAAWLGANTIQDATITNRHEKTAGDLSVGWGEYSVTMVPKAGGDPVTLRGRFTDVAAKRNGKWVYIVDHASDEPAAAH